MKKSQTKPLTKKQTAVVEALLDGESKTKAMQTAGYASGNIESVIDRSAQVQNALKEARAELSTATQIKRADVLEMLMEAYEYAKLVTEPGNMVAAAREIGKMLGYYEPETIRLELNSKEAKLKQKFEVMSDDELMQIAEGKAKVIEGEYVRLS